MRVLVAGSTGVLGRRVVPLLMRSGHAVVGLARNEERAEIVRATGADVALGDLLDRDAVVRAAQGCDAALHLATCIPRRVRTSRADWAENDRVRTTGTANLLAASRAAGVRCYLQQSIALIYGDHGDAWIDESTPIPASLPAIVRSAVEMERLVRESGLPHAILRGGSFYGAGTGTTELMLGLARRRRLPVVRASAFTSLVHVHDMARAVAAVVDSWEDPSLGPRQPAGGAAREGPGRAPTGATFNVVDDEPVRQREFLTCAARLAGGPPPPSMPEWLARLFGGAGIAAVLQSVRVSNARLKQALGFAFTHPTYREGLADAARAAPSRAKA